ncbi:hypothetical protein SAMD00019534_096720, partial [Acytostelium subglobosum LB1]|uniref:hypothetical protein n=1 Tax=Acytostelium subglobosum LB1 TaxID=1410327 RepID=UPI000644A31D
KQRMSKTFGHCIVELADGTTDIYIIKFNQDENRFNDVTTKNINDALDYVESIPEASCLITVGTNPKYYSMGLDLAWVMSIQPMEAAGFILTFQKLMSRLLTIPIPTIAIVNGTAFAGGAMMAMAHDYRLVAKDPSAFFCLPEVDMNLVITPGLNALMQCKIDPTTYRDMLLQARQVTCDEAATYRMVDQCLESSGLMSAALQMAAKVSPKGKNRKTYGGLKREMYKHANIQLLSNDFGEAFK